MGNKPALTVNGKHEITKKWFLTDANSKHCKVKKGFLTVNGVHRLVYSSGVTWAKFSARWVDITYKEDGFATGSETLRFDQGASEGYEYTPELFDSYEFTATDGYSGIGEFAYSKFEDMSPCAGKFYLGGNRVYEIVSVSNDTYPKSWDAEVVASCTEIPSHYVQGYDDYGTIEADEGALPEAGTLIEGSVEEGYCVLQIGGSYYYYTIII